MLFFSLFKTLVGKEVRTAAAPLAATQPALADGRAQPCPHREGAGACSLAASLQTHESYRFHPSHAVKRVTGHACKPVPSLDTQVLVIATQQPSLPSVQCTLTPCGVLRLHPGLPSTNPSPTPCALTHLLIHLHQVTVELKNDLCISGALHSVDQYLNIKLTNTRVHNEQKYPHMVRGGARRGAAQGGSSGQEAGPCG